MDGGIPDMMESIPGNRRCFSGLAVVVDPGALVPGLSLSGLEGGVTALLAGCRPGSVFMSGWSLASKSTESQLVLSDVALTLHFLTSSSSGSDFRFFKFTFLFLIAGLLLDRSVSSAPLSAFLSK